MNGNRTKYAALGTLTTLAALTIIFWTAQALAVPGSGEFIATHSEAGREITALYNMIARICLGVIVIVEGGLLIAIIRFRRRSPDDRPRQNHGDLRLEAGWTLAALTFQVWIGIATIEVMWSTEVLPDDIEMTVQAVAYQWDWQFVYPDQGGITHPDLVVPAHTKVKLEVTARDVIHAIFIPDLGIKIDAVPGRFNYWWFRADGPVNQIRAKNFRTVGPPEYKLPQTRPDFMARGYDATAQDFTNLERRVNFLGASRKVEEVSPYANYSAIEFQGLCAELCGMGHWDMYFRTVIMSKSSFERWVQDKQTSFDEPDGEATFNSTCTVCHGADGEGTGPPNPSLVAADRVINPDRMDDHIEIVLTGSSPMPPFSAVLNDAEVAAVINHERTSWGNDGGTVEPADVARMRESLGLPPFPAGGVDPTPTEELVDIGKQIYQSCASCHGSRGIGPDYIPNIAGNPTVTGDVAELARILINGQDTPQWPGRKTPVARSMTDAQLAGLLTYLRTSFGNEASPVQPFEIKDLRNDVEQAITQNSP